MNPDNILFSFDVESIGLHGEGYAVGFVVVLASGQELDAGCFACDPANAQGDTSDREWVMANIPRFEPNCAYPAQVCEAFWKKWMEWKERGAMMVSDCGWPVEARFLLDCIDADAVARKWDGPYPLIDVSSVLLAHGHDPVGTFPRHANELPKHDPVCDARQSIRVMLEIINEKEVTF